MFCPWVGKIPGVGNGNPLQYSFLESSMDRGASQATVYGVTKSRTWLSAHTHTHTHTHTESVSLWHCRRTCTHTHTHTVSEPMALPSHAHTHTSPTCCGPAALLGLCRCLRLFSRCAEWELLSFRGVGFSLQSTGSRTQALKLMAHRLSCSMACGIFPDQGSNPCPQQWFK